MKHIAKRFLKRNRFPIYTTCGYKVFQSKSDIFSNYAYFIYNSIGVAVSLTSCESMYHTFDGSLTQHQTSVPISVDEENVYFNEHSFFIFAWGNGKSIRRLWLEERGYNISGDRIQATDFERYFGMFTQEEQTHVTQQGWL